MLFYRVVKGAFKCDHLAQLYRNICDVPGEYHSSAMLVLPKHCAVHSMPLPVVAHQRNKYVIFKNGYRYLKQTLIFWKLLVTTVTEVSPSRFVVCRRSGDRRAAI
jgi:hypothetical protein